LYGDLLDESFTPCFSVVKVSGYGMSGLKGYLECLLDWICNLNSGFI
jgi:hypothetical protein